MSNLIGILSNNNNAFWFGDAPTTKIIVPTFTQTLTYNGAEQTAPFNNFDSSMMTVTGNKGTEAGTYNAAFTPKQGYTWEDTNDATTKYVSWSIGVKSIAIPSVSGSFDYDGTEKSATISNTESSYYIISGDISATQVGTYTVTFTLKNTTSTKWADNSTTAKTGTWEIKAVGKTLAVPTYSGALTYNGSEQTASFNGYDSSTMTVSGNEGTNVGNYTATFSLKNQEDKWSDGSTTSKTVQWNINVKTVAIPSVSGDFNYNGEEKTATITGADSSFYTTSGDTSATQAGTYTITFALKDTTNTKWSDDTTIDKAIEWTINKADLSGIVVNEYAGYKYNTTSIPEPTISSNPGNGTVTFYGKSEESGNGIIWSSITGTTFEVGTRYIYATITGMTNYNDYTTGNVSYVIKDENIEEENVENFIDDNKDTELQLGFQCDGNGKFYAKTGAFQSDVDPNIVETGTLIFDAGSAAPSNYGVNLKYAQKLGNVMNYILNQVKGSEYGSETYQFIKGNGRTSNSGDFTAQYLSNSMVNNHGFNEAAGRSVNFTCYFVGQNGDYHTSSADGIFSDRRNAVWFGDDIDIPNAYDPEVKVSNILQFIKDNNGTSQKIGFECNKGKYYVGVGDFPEGESSDIGLRNTGTLIYETTSNELDVEKNYKRAQTAGNLINYILNSIAIIKSNIELYPSTPGTITMSGNNPIWTTSNNDIQKGVYFIQATKQNWDTVTREWYGYYGVQGNYLHSNMTSSVWFDISLDIPHKDDPNVKVSNIEQFIKDNINTSSQIGFQSNSNGGFYAGAGDFGTGSNSTNPGIKDTGILIYDTGNFNVGSKSENYVCAAKLANIINYILYIIKGSEYGTNSYSFPTTPETSNNYYDTTMNRNITNGIWEATGASDYYTVSIYGFSGHFNNQTTSRTSGAFWW